MIGWLIGLTAVAAIALVAAVLDSALEAARVRRETARRLARQRRVR